MDERNVQKFARALRPAPVAADHDDLIVVADELVGHGAELVPPVRVEWVEDVPPHLGEASVDAAMRQALRLLPDDVLVHVADDAVHVLALEGVVRPFDDLDGSHVRRFTGMQWAMHESESEDGRLFECAEFTQRVRQVTGEHLDNGADEVLYVLHGTATTPFGELRSGTALFVARGTPWSAEGDARAVSVLVHDPAPAEQPHAVVDLTAVDEGTATAGRAFLLGATPQVGCRSMTQFIGLIPPGRAPDHFHRYDEVIYVLDGGGYLQIDGEQAPIRAGSCIHLPRTLVHCLANTGENEMRVLGVFTPAGSPAEAYYPDGTLAVVPTEGS